MDSISTTLVIFKPDAVERDDHLDMFKILCAEGFVVESDYKTKLSLKVAQELYQEHRDKEFFDGLCEFMTSGPSMINKVSGPDVVKRMRELVYRLRPIYGTSNRHNAIHSSDSEEAAQREIELFFPKVPVTADYSVLD